MPVGPLHNDAQVKPVRKVGSALFEAPHVNTAMLNRKGEKLSQNKSGIPNWTVNKGSRDNTIEEKML